MPITQDRVATIIEAGKDYQQALRAALRIVEDALQRTMTPNDAFTQMTRLRLLLLESSLLKQPITSPTILATEDMHLQLTRSDNRRRRNNMRRKRGTSNAPPNALQQIYNPDSVRGESRNDSLENRLTDQDALSAFQFKGVSPERVAEIDRYIEMEEKQEKILADIKARREAVEARNKAPKMTGPKDAPGLYDDDEDDSGPLLGGGASTRNKV